MKKILIIPPFSWYMNSYMEYLIRYLSDEFFIEIGQVPYPPYENFLERYPQNSPFMRNPDEYDLLMPVYCRRWGVGDSTGKSEGIDAYRHKMAIFWYEPNESDIQDVAVVGALTPRAEESLKTYPHFKTFHSLRLGIDTDLLRPLNFKREDDLLHVGVVGTHNNPRRMMKEVLLPLADIPGVRLMIFPNTWVNNGGKIEEFGGKKFLDHVVTGEKHGAGLANIYNRMDVYIRMDSDPAYACPLLEAASCGVPVISNNQGIDHLLTEAGAGILCEPDDKEKWGTTRNWCLSAPEEVAQKARNAVIWMRDHPEERKEMGRKGREEIVKNWTWEKHIPAWREFFREGVARANG